MSEKVEGMGESQNAYEKKFEVTNEVKYTDLKISFINSIQVVCQV
jgi:hypothetical protein